ncbi:MAG TPA: hypothetical protein DCR97_02440 [Deltaproteobacteria bacterium]|jgi:large-conductance mechanosensitive channel|nr:hypothetical protein [Deltaproteobacteria bacterium]
MINSERKKGIRLIVIAVLIPLLTLPFLSGFSKDKGFIGNLYDVGIQIRDEAKDRTTADRGPTEKKKLTYGDVIPRRIQFRFILALAVVLLFVGVVKIEQSRRKPDSPETGE